MMTLHDKYLFKSNGYMNYLIVYVLKCILQNYILILEYCNFMEQFIWTLQFYANFK